MIQYCRTDVVGRGLAESFEDEKADLEVEQQRMENLEKGKEAAV